MICRNDKIKIKKGVIPCKQWSVNTSFPFGCGLVAAGTVHTLYSSVQQCWVRDISISDRIWAFLYCTTWLMKVIVSEDKSWMPRILLYQGRLGRIPETLGPCTYKVFSRLDIHRWATGSKKKSKSSSKEVLTLAQFHRGPHFRAVPQRCSP